MSTLALVLRALKTAEVQEDAVAYRDLPTTEEPLPATVEITVYNVWSADDIHSKP